MALDCGADGVVIEVPIGYPKLQYQFGWTWEDVLKKSIDSINYAREKKLHALYFPYDTTRARKEDLTSLLKGIMQESPPYLHWHCRHDGVCVARSHKIHGRNGKTPDRVAC